MKKIMDVKIYQFLIKKVVDGYSPCRRCRGKKKNKLGLILAQRKQRMGTPAVPNCMLKTPVLL
jgi:methylphosphotriester-DNA--protein-cysteine methyltransferase